MRKFLVAALILVVVAGVAASAYLRTRKPAEPLVSQLAVTRGDVLQVVSATGTVEAVRTVEVATQVTGVVRNLYADFNSIVKAGDLVAQIDPAAIEAAIVRDQANLENQMANLERQQIALEDSRSKLRRAEEMFRRKLSTEQDFEAAQVVVRTNEATLKAQEANLKQIRAQLNQDEVNLAYTSIYAPIDGIVINRKVDIGQTVVSNNMATSLYQIAQDLTKMQLKVAIDESDVGMIRPGQATTFRVDAYPEREFSGTVTQVRLQPLVTQNVVTYNTIIDVPNPDLVLKPGMRANARIEIARRSNVLRIPAAALKFKATTDVYQVLGLPMPGDRRGQSVVRVANELVETAATSTAGIASTGASTIEALFGPLVLPETQGRVWVYASDPATKTRSLSSVRVRTGISDGTYVELIEGPGIVEGKMLVAAVDTGKATLPTGNPLMPGRGMRPMGGDHGPH